MIQKHGDSVCDDVRPPVTLQISGSDRGDCKLRVVKIAALERAVSITKTDLHFAVSLSVGHR